MSIYNKSWTKVKPEIEIISKETTVARLESRPRERLTQSRIQDNARLSRCCSDGQGSQCYGFSSVVVGFKDELFKNMVDLKYMLWVLSNKHVINLSCTICKRNNYSL